MRTKFVSFTSDFRYNGDVNIWHSATFFLNEWLAEHPSVVVVNWKVCATGKDACCTIVAEYYDQQGI